MAKAPDIIDNSYTTVDFADGTRAMLDLSMFAEGAENQEEITAVGDTARLDVLIPEGAIVRSPRVGVAIRSRSHAARWRSTHRRWPRAAITDRPSTSTSASSRRCVAKARSRSPRATA